MLTARQVFRHRHEIESGRTSSISQQIMGLDTAGNLVKSSNGLREMEWGEIVAASSKASLPSHLPPLPPQPPPLALAFPTMCLTALPSSS